MPANASTLRLAVVLCASFLWTARAQALKGSDAAPQQVKDGDSAFARGDYELARQSFEKAWQAVQSSPANSPLRYNILQRLTAAAAASGRFDDAERYQERAVEGRESKSVANTPGFLGDLRLLITLQLRTGDFDRALATAERVQAMDIAAHTAASLAVSDDYLRVAQIYMAQGKPREAAQAFASADGLRIKLAGSLDPGRLPILDGLCEAFGAIAGGNGAGNESSYRQALAIRETLYGQDSSELISTLEGLAEAYTAAGEYEAAEPIYKRLLSSWEKLVGSEHPMVAVTLDKLVVFYAKQGKTDEAREALARSVDIRARFLAVGLSHQGADETAQGLRDAAIASYHRALDALGSGPANADLISEIREAVSKIEKATK
jgi:tetratricopeptide (TPR) repeat protein